MARSGTTSFNPLKRRDFIDIRNLEVADALDPALQRTVDVAAVRPFKQFLCTAVAVQY